MSSKYPWRNIRGERAGWFPLECKSHLTFNVQYCLRWTRRIWSIDGSVFVMTRVKHADGLKLSQAMTYK